MDLLPNRQAATLAAWLARHPGVQVICRDRAGAYADGATTGAPEAIQVADRYHLWRNLSDYVDKAVHRNRAEIREPAPDHAVPQAPGTPGPTDTPESIGAPVPPEPPHGSEAGLMVRTRERHAAIHALAAKGVGNTAICRALNLDHKTVLRYVRAATVEELLTKTIGRTSLLDPYKPYLHQRWNDGCSDAVRLTKEIIERGYHGSARTVRRYLHDFRGTLIPAIQPNANGPSPKDVTGWILRHPDTLTEEEKLQLKRIRERCGHLDRLAVHVTDFAEMLTERHGHLLKDWLSRVEADDIPELKRMAAGIHRDLDAVTAGLTLEHSSGAVEGNVNRIKMIKRQTYGRAGLALLRKRVLLAR